jgi:DNA polymerase III subunit beta
MKFSCNQKELISALVSVNSAIPTKPAHPILVNVLVEAYVNNFAVFTGFDLALGIQIKISAKVEESGIICLPAKLLIEIISRLPNEEISIEIDLEAETIAAIKTGNKSYKILAKEGTDFPALPIIDNDKSRSFPANALIDALKACLFAVAEDETKQMLTGVNILVKSDGAIALAATDGHRLATAKISSQIQQSILENQEEEEEDLNITIPSKSLEALKKLIPNGKGSEEEITLYYQDNQLVLKLGDRTLTTRTLAGTYPNYQALIPTKFTTEITLNKSQLLESLERLFVLADRKHNLAKFVVSTVERSLHMLVSTKDVGNGSESLNCGIVGSDLTIGFNSKFLIDSLKALPGEEVLLQIAEEGKPALLIPLGGFKITHLVMPVAWSE